MQTNMYNVMKLNEGEKLLLARSSESRWVEGFGWDRRWDALLGPIQAKR